MAHFTFPIFSERKVIGQGFYNEEIKPGSKFNISIVVENIGSDFQKVTPIIQILMNGAMRGLYHDTQTIQPLESKTFEFSVDIPSNFDSLPEHVLKFFLWDSLDAMNPLAGTVDMLYTSSANTIVKIAKGELGIAEDPLGSNKTKYNDWFGMPGEPWCAMFVSWCAWKAGMLNNLFPKKTASVWEIKDTYERDGRYKYRSSGYIPKAGDIVIFYNSTSAYRHTGIVAGYVESENRIYTVEGNSSDKVSARYYNLNEPIDIQGYCVNGGTSNGSAIPGATKGNNASYQ